MQWYQDTPVRLPVKFLKKDGSDGAGSDVQVESSDGAVATFTYKDGFIYPTSNAVGKGTAKVSADVDPGEGVVRIETLFDFEILGRFAENIVVGEVEEIAPAAEPAPDPAPPA